MTFDPTSRYAGIATSVYETTDAGGNVQLIRYVQRRLLPTPDPTAAVIQHLVTPGERLDVVTALYAGDPTLYWQLCDASEVMLPEELDQVGAVIRIPLQGS